MRWVAVHEVTHAVQFTGVPWLRDHLAALLRELLAGVDVEVDSRRRCADAHAATTSSGSSDRRARGRPRHGRRGARASGDLLDRLQATMAVVEGHAEHVMDAVGRDVLPDLDRLRDALDAGARTARRRGSCWSGCWAWR